MNNIDLLNLINTDKILHELLSQIREITLSDAGTIYLQNEDYLEFKIFQNDTLPFNKTKDLNFKKLPLNDTSYIAVESFLSSKMIKIDDVYKESGFRVKEIKSFDKKYDYKTHSMITIPLVDNYNNKTIGIMQIINKNKDKELITYTDLDEKLIKIASNFICFMIIRSMDYKESLIDIHGAINLDFNNRIEIDKVINFENRVKHTSKTIIDVSSQIRGALSELTMNNMYLTSGEKDINYIDILKDNEKIIQFISAILSKFELAYDNKNQLCFNIFNTYKIVYDLIKSHATNYNVNIIHDIDEKIEIKGEKELFIQIILSIVQNSFDMFRKRKINNPQIKIFAKEVKDKINIIITDNAGGLDNRLLLLFESEKTKKIITKTMTLNIIELIVKDKFKGDFTLHNAKEGLEIKISLNKNLQRETNG